MRNLQKPDTQLKQFWQDGEHFADVYNATMFQGKSVLCPQQLTEQDSALFVNLQITSSYISPYSAN